MRYFGVLGLVAVCGIHAQGQVVQLPSVSTFGTTGTVSVPDQGTAYLGGTRGMRSGLSTSGAGPLAARARGGAVSGTTVSASVTIIDLQAMDEALLNRPPEKLPPSSYPAMSQDKAIVNTLAPKNYERMMNQRARNTHTPNDWAIALGSAGDAIVDRNSVESNVRFFMDKASAAHAAGHEAAAKVYYRMALERMTPDQLERYSKLQERNTEAARRGIAPDKLNEVMAQEAKEKAAKKS